MSCNILHYLNKFFIEDLEAPKWIGLVQSSDDISERISPFRDDCWREYGE